jgi:hypothetical protein
MNRIENRRIKLQQVAHYRASGLTLKQWCIKNNEKYTTMKYWIAKVRKEKSSGGQASVSDNQGANPWVQLKAETKDHEKPIDHQKSRASGTYRIHIENMQLEVPQGFDAQELRSLIKVMQTC